MPSILILDDDAELADALCLTLQQYQFEADWAPSAPDAIEQIKKRSFDLILLDYAMPKQDGLWFMRHVKPPRKTKVVLMTGYLDRQVINEMFSMGACGYMIKPFDNETLLHNVRFYLNHAISA